MPIQSWAHLRAAHVMLGTVLLPQENSGSFDRGLILGASLNHYSPWESLGYLLGCKRGLTSGLWSFLSPYSPPLHCNYVNSVITRGENGITRSHISGFPLAISPSQFHVSALRTDRGQRDGLRSSSSAFCPAHPASMVPLGLL